MRDDFGKKKWFKIELITLAIMIGVYVSYQPISFASDASPRMRADTNGETGIQDGVLEKKNFLGVVVEKISYKDGRRNGTTIQYYPNGSTLRELTYYSGKLHGICKEYYLKRRQLVSRFHVPKDGEFIGSGRLKWYKHYSNGILHGTYEEYHEDGVVKDNGRYKKGKIDVLASP